MGNYILRTLFRAIVSMLAIVTIAFVLLRSGPVDPAYFILGDYATEESIRNIRAELKLDRPMYVQYAYFLRDLARGDLGRSFINNEPVQSQLMAVLPYTLELLLAALVLGLLLGVPAGILAALKPNTILDHSIRLFTLVGISVPTLVSGIFLISIFSLGLDLLPIFSVRGTGNLKDRILLLILPAFSCAIWMLASVARLTRASLLDVLNKDYVTTARSKGLSETLVILKHALRNALLPLITYLGITINILLGSAVLTEIVFTRPGVGRLIVEGIISGDFQMVQSIIMLYGGVVVIVNLLVDLGYSLVDPRIIHK